MELSNPTHHVLMLPRFSPTVCTASILGGNRYSNMIDSSLWLLKRFRVRGYINAPETGVVKMRGVEKGDLGRAACVKVPVR